MRRLLLISALASAVLLYRQRHAINDRLWRLAHRWLCTVDIVEGSLPQDVTTTDIDGGKPVVTFWFSRN